MRMALIKWEPFNDLNSFFEDARPSFLGGDMAIDMYEEGQNIIAEMNLAGVDPEKVNVSVEGNYLRITSEREEESEKKEKHFYSKEIRRGSFERAVRIPENIDEGSVTAEYSQGVLKVILPKKEGVKEKIKIEVKK